MRRGVDSTSPSREIRKDIKDIVKTFDSTEIGVLLSQVEEELQDRAKQAIQTISDKKEGKLNKNTAQIDYLRSLQDTLHQSPPLIERNSQETPIFDPLTKDKRLG